jgi:proteic killer suppression protein
VGGSAVDISWRDRKLERTCSSDVAGQRRWGADNWTVMKRRLLALSAVPALSDLEGAPGRCHQLGANRREEFAMHLWGPYRLIFVPDHDPIPRLEDGGIDRSLITRVVITEVVDYHGE